MPRSRLLASLIASMLLVPGAEPSYARSPSKARPYAAPGKQAKKNGAKKPKAQGDAKKAEAPEMPAEEMRKRLRELQPAIDKAIDRGVEYLLRCQQRDGSWGSRTHQYRNGQTALSTYTLIKGGVDRHHPSVVRALDYLSRALPTETYSAGCELMLLSVVRDPAYAKRAKAILDRLLEWQLQGAWGYPKVHQAGGHWGKKDSRPDLSNMQYAALGLRAAKSLGLEVPTKALKLLIARTLDHQERVSSKEERRQRRYGEPRTRGFCYTGKRGYGGNGKPTGSMTSAGVSILRICLDLLGERVNARYIRQIEIEIDAGVRWLAANFSVTKNPNGGWLYYYLYGLERVGGLTGLGQFGKHWWYLPGAKNLVGRQGKKDGDWQRGESQTCFAVLFLKRATAPTTGGGPSKQRDVWTSAGRASKLRIRGTGHSELSLWVTGFDDETKRKHEEYGLRIDRVEWFIDGEKFATVRGQVDKAWDGEAFAAQYRFTKPGEYEFRAKAYVLPEDIATGGQGELQVVEAAGFTVPVRQVLSGWMKAELDARDRNLLLRTKVEASATTHQKAHPPHHAVDGHQAQRWLCNKDDANPSLTLKLGKWVEAERIVLEQAVVNTFEKGMYDAIRRVRVTLNGRDKFEFALEEDDYQPTVFDFAKKQRIRRLQIEVLERENGWAWPGVAGFSEVRLERAQSPKR